MPPEADQNQDDQSQSDAAPGGAGAGDTQDKSPDKEATKDQPDAPVRPEGLPDDYWSQADGVLLPDLITRFTELTGFKAEADVKASGIPQAADGYALPEAEQLRALAGIGDDVEVEFDENHPMLGPAREFAHAHGLTQEAFNGLVGLKLKADQAEAASLNELREAEIAKLGDAGRDRVTAVATALKARIGSKATEALYGMMFTAEQVEAFEALVRGTRAPGYTSGGEAANRGPEWDKLSPDEKIWEARRRQREKGRAA